jgi:hypothetical protein
VGAISAVSVQSPNSPFTVDPASGLSPACHVGLEKHFSQNEIVRSERILPRLETGDPFSLNDANPEKSENNIV